MRPPTPGQHPESGWTTEGRLAWRQLPDGSREEWTWDGEGNLTSHTDRMGRSTHHTVTHFDKPSATTTTDGADYRFTHDTELRLTAVTNAAGLQWTYTYDAAGRLTSETDFDGRTITYEHDALGRLTRRTNAAGQPSPSNVTSWAVSRTCAMTTARPPPSPAMTAAMSPASPTPTPSST
ncbi:hypothetical protein ACFQ3Z_44630 [Streptomyces nogalater]